MLKAKKQLTKGQEMKKIFIIIFSFLLISSTSFAGSCPALLKQVDEKITKSKLSADKLKAIKTLRNNGEKAHKSGKHTDSEKFLNQALKDLG